MYILFKTIKLSYTINRAYLYTIYILGKYYIVRVKVIFIEKVVKVLLIEVVVLNI